MTHAEMMRRVSYHEFVRWAALYRLEQEERKKK
jgi:hypothetical protein